MSNRKNIVRVWIGDPYRDGHFNGTAFFIDSHTLVTAKHVVLDHDGKVYSDIYLSNMPDGGMTPVAEVVECKRDMVVLKVKKAFEIDAVTFSDGINEGDKVNVRGFYDGESSQKSYENHVSGYLNRENTYELQNHLTHGLSGSPVFLGSHICGVTKAINSSKNLTYVIPITELCVKIEMSKTEPKKVHDDAPFSLGIIKKIYKSLTVVTVPFIILMILMVGASKLLFPNVELKDTVFAFIFVAFVLSKFYSYVASKFKKETK
jgi:hypothetical protein